MRKIKVLAALAMALTVAFSCVAFAAPSPVAGTVTVLVPGKAGAEAATIQAPTQEQIVALANFIAENAAAIGMTPSVKTTISIVAPADYKGGDVPVVIAAAGLKDGAQNVFAYLLLPNGKTIILPVTVKNGYVGFVAPAFGTVSIVEMLPGASTAANAGFGLGTTAPATPATLH